MSTFEDRCGDFRRSMYRPVVCVDESQFKTTITTLLPGLLWYSVLQERNQGYALLMIANKTGAMLYRAPTLFPFLHAIISFLVHGYTGRIRILKLIIMMRITHTVMILVCIIRIYKNILPLCRAQIGRLIFEVIWTPGHTIGKDKGTRETVTRNYVCSAT